MAAHERFVRSDGAAFAAELAEVDRLAALLTAHLDARADVIDRLHQHTAQSHAIQAEVSALPVRELRSGRRSSSRRASGS